MKKSIENYRVISLVAQKVRTLHGRAITPVGPIPLFILKLENLQNIQILGANE